jgi:hypothetical protein
VEQVGSVYETMMGFRLEMTTGRSVAVKAQKKQGAPTAVDLEALLAEPAARREKWLQDRTDRKLTDKVQKAAIVRPIPHPYAVGAKQRRQTEDRDAIRRKRLAGADPRAYVRAGDTDL